MWVIIFFCEINDFFMTFFREIDFIFDLTRFLKKNCGIFAVKIVDKNIPQNSGSFFSTFSHGIGWDVAKVKRENPKNGLAHYSSLTYSIWTSYLVKSIYIVGNSRWLFPYFIHKTFIQQQSIVIIHCSAVRSKK